MQLWFYPVDGGAPTPYQLVGRDGGFVSIAPGSYNIICLDGAHENIVYSGTDSFDGFEISTRTTSVLAPMKRVASNVPKAVNTESQEVITVPDPVYGYSIGDVRIPENEDCVITLYPEPLTATYEVVVRNVENLSRASEISATMSGLGGGLKVSTKSLTGDPCLMPFEVVKLNSTTISGVFMAFGHQPTSEVKHSVVVYAVMEDGEQRYQIFDDENGEISIQIDASPDPYYYRIDLEKLNLPEVSSGGGMGIAIGEWGNETFDITLGKINN